MEKFVRIATFSLFLFSFTACMETINEVEIDQFEPEIAIPLLNTAISMQDLIDNFESGGYLGTDDDELLTVVYEGNVLSPTSAEVVTFPNLTIPVWDTMATVPVSSLPMEFSIQQFDIKSGQFGYSFRSSAMEDLKVDLQILNLKNNNTVFETSMIVNHQNGDIVEMDNVVDIAGYSLDLRAGNFEMRYMAMGMTSGQRTYLQELKYHLNDLVYSYVEGNFGSYDIDVALDEILINIFESTSVNNLYIEDPKINIHFNNGYGIPIEVRAEKLEVVSIDNVMIPVTSELDDGFSFNYPTLNEVGSYQRTTLSLDKNNSNIADVIAHSPVRLDYQFMAKTFPNGSSDVGFVLDDSYFSVDVDVELPMWFSASAMNKNTVEEFDGSSLENVKEAEFKLIVENGFPVDAGVQVYFEDDNGNTLDSLIQPFTYFMDAAEIDSQGKVTAPTSSTLMIPMEGDRLANIVEATHIRLKGEMVTAGNAAQSVRFYAQDKIGVKLGVKAILKD